LDSFIPPNQIWHIGMTSDLPKRVFFHSREFALWSPTPNTNEFVLQSNICPHNSYPIMGGVMQGSVKDGCLVCPFHGSRFRSDGYLLHPISDAVLYRGIQRFPVIHSNGDLWSVFGSDENSQQPKPPLLNYGQMFYRFRKVVHAPWYRMVQVAMDLMHVQYVHAKTFGKGIRQVQVQGESLEKAEGFGTVSLIVMHANHGSMEMTVSFYFPGVVVIDHFLQTTVILVRPVSQVSCYTEARIYPKLAGPYAGLIYLLCKMGMFEWRLPMVVLEDEAFISQIDPDADPFTETLMAEDVLWKYFRGLLKETLNV
jgi:phenylpropionate dioxygenase-like ring-hydroxylating dioxygenase large terminal subunit